MNKVLSALVVVFAGAAAASLLKAWRERELEAGSQEKEDIQRWEDEGGKVPGNA